MFTYFKTEAEEKNTGIRGKFLKKWKICLQNLTKEWKQPSVVIL